jgi:protein-S-isoprenylcysteine O-methyltransferase Ste14
VTEAILHYWLTLGLFALGAVTLTLLLWISAPYGRHARRGWGPVVPRRVAWVVMESPAVLGFGTVYFMGSQRAAVIPLAFLTLWQLHYIHRTFVYPFRAAASGTPWPASIVFLAFLFQTYNAYLNGRWVSHLGQYTVDWALDPRFVLGVLIFGAGFALNLWSDGTLRRLRQPGNTDYHVPRGGLFELVSCPNYLGEILEWIGWALATWSLAGAAFAVYTIANLGPRALSHHRWYRERFDDYPRERKALVPYLW